MKIPVDEQNFCLPGTSSTFNERQKSIYDVLDKVQKPPENRYSAEDFQRSQRKFSKTLTSEKSQLKQFVGQESIFKRPEVQPKKAWKRRLPDFQTNPHKWTKYTLNNISLNEMTDKTNNETAMAFFKELAERNIEKMEELDTSLPPMRVLFNKNVKLSSEPKLSSGSKSEDDITKPSFVKGKYVMPEYVVGQKIKKPKISKRPSETLPAVVKLDHLLAEDD